MTQLPWQPPDDVARRLLDERIDSYEVEATSMTWWERLLAWLDDALSLSTDASGTGGIVLTILLGVAVIVLVWLLVRYFRPSLVETSGQQTAHLVDPSITAEQYLADARRLLANDALDEAYLQAFRSMVRASSQRGLLEVAPSTTATLFGWSLGAVLPDHSQQLNEAAQTFNAISYGGNMPVRSQTEAVVHLAQVVATAQPQSDPDAMSPARLMPR